MQYLLSTVLMASVVMAATAPSFSKNAVFPSVFTDPSLVQEPNGQYWSFGSSNNVSNVPSAESVDFVKWTMQSSDALPHAGIWAASAPAVLSPNVKPLVCCATQKSSVAILIMFRTMASMSCITLQH